jgi:hypothetical protein
MFHFLSLLYFSFTFIYILFFYFYIEGSGIYTSISFTSQMALRGHLSHKQGFSYPNLMSGLTVTLKLEYSGLYDHLWE